MSDMPLSHTWAMRLWFLVLCAVIIFFHLMPLETTPRNWAPPDLLIAFILAWALRRPDYVPALSVAAVILMADLLFQRPPGLMALLVVLGCEFLKSRANSHGETSFIVEWFNVCVVIAGITVLDRLILTMTLVDRAPLSLHLIQMVLTMAIYPLAAFVTQTLLGVRRPSPGNSDALGNR
ncbi:rod shape-determining protein MreD [Sedimentitalea sp. XS_ASV28]|uniref:rod shape-determining protein MreD n=1 Tax=Sedimentitalea sp. XS_ASV28 TaxID=3241296 RepID=UPI0035114C49